MVLLATVGLRRLCGGQYRSTIVSTVKADSLHAAAVQVAQVGRHRDAARLYRRSAEFRAAEDPAGARLTEAAALAYAAGDHSAARQDMARAAEQALTQRRPQRSGARAFDAAWIAQEQQKPNQGGAGPSGRNIGGHRSSVSPTTPSSGGSIGRRMPCGWLLSSKYRAVGCKGR